MEREDDDVIAQLRRCFVSARPVQRPAWRCASANASWTKSAAALTLRSGASARSATKSR